MEFSVVHNYLEGNYILHEFLADRSNFLAQGSRKHHHLLFVWSVPEDFLHVTPHVCASTEKVHYYLNVSKDR